MLSFSNSDHFVSHDGCAFSTLVPNLWEVTSADSFEAVICLAASPPMEPRIDLNPTYRICILGRRHLQHRINSRLEEALAMEERKEDMSQVF